ncbi:MAG: hypothetical protein MUF84_19150 [Anaerolineae bacterium]|nr:hypothetical protein [Anaerolineae bacterium]
MSDPVVFISRFRVKDGLLDAFLEHYRQSIPVTEAAKPDTLVQLAYDLQLQGADQRSQTTLQFIEPAGIEIYGSPNALAMERMKRVAGTNIDVKIDSQFVGGFVRPRSG